MPSCVMAAFISSAAANGGFERNIFRFYHMHMNNTYMTFGTKKFPAVEFKPKFPDSIVDRDIDVTRMYRMFLRGYLKYLFKKKRYIVNV